MRPDRYTPEQRREYMASYRAKRMAAAQAFLGGACVDCGATDSLTFDHVDPATKVKPVTALLHAAAAKFWAEVRKCVLRCEACHKVKTAEHHENRQKFTSEQVQALRLRFAAGDISKKALAREFGVTPTVIRMIVQRETYKHVA